MDTATQVNILSPCPNNYREAQVETGKAILRETVSLLVGLIKSIDPDRLGKDAHPYGSSAAIGEQGQKREQAQE